MNRSLEDRLARFARRLVDQQAARVIIEPDLREQGAWFGGGNLVEDSSGSMFLVGRYRNPGDSREGTAQGKRGFALAILQSDDRGKSFRELHRWGKQDLAPSNGQVLSIEGSALNCTSDGVELFVSTEKSWPPYPADLKQFQKPGTGVWTIDRVFADTIKQLPGSAVTNVVCSQDPRWLHVKDPFVYADKNGDDFLLFCTHPFCWTSSNTAFTIRRKDAKEFLDPDFTFFPRGFTWDVAMTRGTCVLKVPQVGAFENRHVTLMFYDGGESVRNLDEHAAAVSRPRGLFV